MVDRTALQGPPGNLRFRASVLTLLALQRVLGKGAKLSEGKQSFRAVAMDERTFVLKTRGAIPIFA